MPNVQWKTPDDGQRRCPKHVEFYNRINIWIISASGRLFKNKRYLHCFAPKTKTKRFFETSVYIY